MPDAKFEYALGLELASGNVLWDANLVSVWHMNSDWLDAKGSNHGTRYGTGTEFDTVNHILGSAAGLYNGVDDYNDMGNPANLSYDYNEPFSFAFWVSFDSLGVSHTLFAKSNKSTDVGYYCILSSANKLTFFLTSVATTSQIYIAETTASITNANQKYHIVITYDGSTYASGVKIYVDKVDKALTIVRNNLSSSTITTKTFQLGVRDNTDVELAGLLDEVAAFNDELSSAEVTALYDEQNTPINVTIPNFESLPLDRPSEKFQSAQVLGGGDVIVQDLGKTVQYVKLNIKYLSKVKYDELVAFFQSPINYMGNVFTFTDQLGTVYSNMRLTKPGFSLPRVTNNENAMYSGQLIIKSDPT